MLNKSLNSSLVKSAGIYTIASGINSAIPFLLLPVLTRYLSTEDYGLVSMFGVLSSILLPFTCMSVNTAIPKVYSDRERVDVKSYVTNYLYIMIISTVLISLIIYLLAEPISRLASVPIDWLWIVVVLAFAQGITYVVLAIYQVQFKAVSYGVFQILFTFMNAVLSILFVVYMGMNWQGRMQAQLITFVTFAVVGVLIIWRDKWLKLKVNINYIKHALSFGAPLIPHSIAGLVIMMTDRVFITNMVGLQATGIYTVGYQIGMIISIIADSFHRAFVPWLYEQLKLNEFTRKITIVKLTYACFAGIMVLALVLALIAPWFLSFFVGKAFTGSAIFVVWIAIGFAFQGMYLLVVNYIYYAEKTSILAWVTFVTAAVNIAVNYFAIRGYGAIGAAYSTTAINLLKFALVWILAAKVYDMPWGLFLSKRSKEISVR